MSRIRLVYLLIGVLVFSLFSFQVSFVGDFFSKSSQTLFKPILVGFSSFSQQLNHIRFNFYDYFDAVSQQEESSRKIEALEMELAKLEEIRKENDRLKRILRFRKEVPYKTMGARVIGYELKPWRKSIVLDKGTHHGILPQTVLVSEAGLVGRVIKINPLSAQALLITDPDSRVSVMTGKSRSHGILEGQGDDVLLLRYLSLDDEVELGELIVTSGVGGIFKKGIPIGKVVEVQRDKDGLHLSAVVEPSVKFSKLEEVLCVLS